MTKMESVFTIGQKVKAISFVDCFGKTRHEVPNLTVTKVTLHPAPGCCDPHMKAYYRIVATDETGFGYVEGAERYFEALDENNEDDGLCHTCNTMLELWGDTTICPNCKALQDENNRN
jgi:hypothetical protein